VCCECSLVVSVMDVVKEFPGAPIHVIPVKPWGRCGARSDECNSRRRMMMVMMIMII
jgi:hypothetical protein